MSITARVSDGSLVEAVDIQAPDEVVAEEPFTITATIKNNATFIGGGDPDSCDGPTGANGYDLRIDVETFGSPIFVDYTCIGPLTTQDVEIEVPGIANPGEKQLGFTVYGRNTLNELGATSTTIQVLEPFSAADVNVTCEGIEPQTTRPGETFTPTARVENGNERSADAVLAVLANGSVIYSEEIRVALGATYTPSVVAPEGEGTYDIEVELRDIRSVSPAPVKRTPFRNLTG